MTIKLTIKSLYITFYQKLKKRCFYMEELRSVSVSDFKAHCLQYLEEANSLKIECVVTKRGKPIAKLIPIESKQQSFKFGSMSGTGSIKGDVVEPINTDWEVC